MIIITDGQPTDDPCQYKGWLDRSGVTVVIIGVGDFEAQYVSPFFWNLVSANEIQSSVLNLTFFKVSFFGQYTPTR